MKREEMEVIAAGVVDSVSKTVKGPLVHGRIEALEARIAALESKPTVKFEGVWKSDRDYAIGSAVTHHGGLWICKAATRGEPGKDFSSWQLAVKKGQA